MFDSLSSRLESVFNRLRGKGRLSREDVEEGLKEIRLALLEADVALPVVATFLDRVRDAAVGEEVLRSVTPGQQLVKVVHDELVRLLGGEQRPVVLAEQPPTVILLVGLQGSGKTTAAAKLAVALRRDHDAKPLLAACDLQRPAAVDQLQTLGEQIGVDVEAGEAGGDPVPVAKRALERARDGGYDVLIVDSAGRLHVDEELMDQARAIRDAVQPHETMLVLNSTTGQDAVNAASAFGQELEPTGSILTMLDGDARGGAALSLVEVTGVPILYAGVGERTDDLEAFHPDRMASRILGMGDILSLVERAEREIAEEDADALEQKIREATFDLADFLDQLQMIKKMGPVQNLIGMLPQIPGIGRIEEDQIDESQLVRTEAIIRSMTPAERAKPEIIDGSRRRRIAGGSGTNPQDVNMVLTQFDAMRKMMRKMAGPLSPSRKRKRSRKARKSMPKMKGF